MKEWKRGRVEEWVSERRRVKESEYGKEHELKRKSYRQKE